MPSTVLNVLIAMLSFSLHSSLMRHVPLSSPFYGLENKFLKVAFLRIHKLKSSSLASTYSALDNHHLCSVFAPSCTGEDKPQEEVQTRSRKS